MIRLRKDIMPHSGGHDIIQSKTAKNQIFSGIKFIATIFPTASLIKSVNHQVANSPADKYLVDKVLSGDTQTFGLIIQHTEGLVAQIVYKMIANVQDRKDLAQDIYLKAFHKLSGFKFESKLSTWIGKIAYNTCLTFLEKRKLILQEDLQEGKASEEPEEILQPVYQKELSIILRAETEKLPPIYRTLITLYHQEELSYGEMAQITELPEGTVKSYLFRARKMLKESLLANYKKEEL
jgi:RNA polymerase sigma factor (sigma-70 family)